MKKESTGFKIFDRIMEKAHGRGRISHNCQIKECESGYIYQMTCTEEEWDKNPGSCEMCVPGKGNAKSQKTYKKGGFNWLGDSDVFSERKISLQIMLLKYGLSDKKGIYNERKEMHKKIDNLINTEETMLICMKFKDLKHWRIFNI